MNRRILLLVAATTSAVVLAFVIPLGLLVRSLAADRATADADAEARNVAILVSSLHETPSLADAVAAVDNRSSARTTVVLAENALLGSGHVAVDAPDVLRARTGEAFTSSEGGGLRTVIPVLTSNGTDVVITDVTEEQLRRGVAMAWLVLAALGLFMLMTALMIAARIGRRISTPVTRVAAVADELREGHLDARATVEGPAETQALAVALNRLAERITELLHNERAAVGDLSHRLRTPVTALRIDVDRVVDGQLAERLRQHVGHLQRTIDAIVKDARRPVRNEMDAVCDLAEVVSERVSFWSALAEDQQRSLQVEIAAGPLMVRLDARDLRDVVDILIDNVFAHTAEGVGFAIAVEVHADRLELRVVDSGRGGSVETGPDHGSTGLGLQIVRRTVAPIGGQLDVMQTAIGTTATLSLPADQSS